MSLHLDICSADLWILEARFETRKIALASSCYFFFGAALAAAAALGGVGDGPLAGCPFPFCAAAGAPFFGAPKPSLAPLSARASRAAFASSRSRALFSTTIGPQGVHVYSC